MFLETFSDRFAPIVFDLDKQDKERILELRSLRDLKHGLPTVELPLEDA